MCGRPPYEVSKDTLKVLLTCLPDLYRDMAIAALADRLTNDMRLHVLELIATFYKNAEQEGIDERERDETLQDILQGRE